MVVLYVLVKKINTGEFIKKSHKIHGNKYNYDKVNYIDNKTKVLIKCELHGLFEQIPNNHLNGYGCIKCSGKEKLNTEIFIERSIKIHGNNYIYDKSKYSNISEKIIITCIKHGDFVQSSKSHLEGHGCFTCNKSKGEIEIETLLQNKEINYIPQYTFDDLKYKQKLQFDFGILYNGELKKLNHKGIFIMRNLNLIKD